MAPANEGPVSSALGFVAARSDGGPIDRSLRVTVNFHPDRLVSGELMIAGLAREGTYRSQFETGTSAGGLTAHPGGDRWEWESRMFGEAYDGAPPSARPKYGALNFRRRPAGGSPRFGSSYLRLAEALLERATFCYPDSVFQPVHFGVAAHMSLIALAEADDKDLLDDYIEAHVHGPLVIGEDVEALVLDACYRGTEVEKAARRLACPVEWHPGHRLSVEELRRYPDYRGQEDVELGLSLAVDGYLDPKVIGDAARTGKYDDRQLKRVWHYVAALWRTIAHGSFVTLGR